MILGMRIYWTNPDRTRVMFADVHPEVDDTDCEAMLNTGFMATVNSEAGNWGYDDRYDDLPSEQWDCCCCGKRPYTDHDPECPHYGAAEEFAALLRES